MQLSMMLEIKRLRQSNKLNRKLDANVQRWITLMKVIIINSTAIRNTLDTTQDERNVAIAALNKIVNAIKNDIAQNKTNAEVDQTEADGNNNIKVIFT